MRALVRALVIAGAGACGGDDVPPLMLACDGAVTDVPNQPGIHVAIGSSIQWSSNPPATGMHYPMWARWDRHYTSLDRGFYIHNAEHGGVVFLYNCPTDCPDVVAQLIDSVRTFSADDSCSAPVRNRMLVVADPMMPADVQVAAVAWNAVYTASCFDPYIQTFARNHYNRAPEDLCIDGIDAGGTVIDPP
jgi:hypothetical protein